MGGVKRNARGRKGAVVLVACGLGLAGSVSCVTPPQGIQTVEGKEQDDIPVPKTLELERSYSPLAAEEASFRSWHGYYRGPGQFGDLPPWYVVEMRKHGWTFLGAEGSESIKRLDFSKGDELARIEIYRELDPRQSSFVNVVHAEIHPRGSEDVALEDHIRSLDEVEIKPASFQMGGLPTETAPGLPTETAPGHPTETAPGHPTETAPGLPTETAPGHPTDTAPGLPSAAAEPPVETRGTRPPILDEIDEAEGGK
jgi:hypothetical protein